MTSIEKNNIIGSFVLAIISGALIYIIDNYFQVQTEWGTESSPYLSLVKIFHYLSTPLLILSIGFIIKSHIYKKVTQLKTQTKKTTGTILCIGLVLIIYTGQSLLFVTNDTLKEILIYLHLFFGLTSASAMLVHLKN